MSPWQRRSTQASVTYKEANFVLNTSSYPLRVNTEIARAIADGLGESSEVRLAEVSDAPREPDPEIALIMTGGPTHAFSISRTNTRADAIKSGAKEGEREFGLREWMASLTSGRHTAKIATYDTKIEACVCARVSGQRRC